MMTRRILICGLAIALLSGHSSVVHAQEFTPGKGVSSNTETSQGINWQSTTVQTKSFRATLRPPVVTGVSIQPGGSMVAMVGDDHIVGLYNRATGRFDQQLTEHTDWVRTARFSPSGTQLATAGNDRRLIVWDTTDTSRTVTPRQIATHPAAIADVSWSSDGSMLATAGFEDKVRIYSVSTGDEIAQITASCADLRTIAFSADDRTIAFGGRNGKVEIWDVATKTQIDSLNLHTRRIRALAFTGLNQLVTCGDDGLVHIIDRNNTANIRTLPAHGGKLFAVCPLNDDLLATAGSNNKIYIWSLRDLEQVGTLAGHTGSITSLDFEDRVLASGSYDTRVRFWTTEKVARVPDLDTFRR